MSEIKVPAINRSKRLPRLYDVWLALDEQADFSSFAENLGLVERIIRSDYATGLERGLKDLIPFTATCELPGAPPIFARSKKAIARHRDAALAQHDTMLADDKLHATSLLERHKGLVVVTNVAGEPYAEVSGVETVESATAGVTTLTAYSGSVVLAATPRSRIVCDVELLPTSDMRTYISDVLLEEL